MKNTSTCRKILAETGNWQNNCTAKAARKILT